MAKVEYEVCDRCGVKINYHSRHLAKVCRTKIKWIICGITQEYNYQLCEECSDKLDDFLYKK